MLAQNRFIYIFVRVMRVVHMWLFDKRDANLYTLLPSLSYIRVCNIMEHVMSDEI